MKATGIKDSQHEWSRKEYVSVTDVDGRGDVLQVGYVGVVLLRT
jgi:hypothetical protein